MKKYICLLLVSFLFSCSTPELIISNYSQAPVDINAAIDRTDSLEFISLTMNSRDHSEAEKAFIEGISDIKVKVSDKEKLMAVYSFKDPVKTFFKSDNKKHISKCSGKLSVPIQKGAKEYYFEIKSNGKFYTYKTTFEGLKSNYGSKKEIELLPFTVENDNNTVTIGVRAIRNKITQEIFFQNHETINVKVLKQDGSILWHSGDKFFPQEKLEFRPKSTDKTHTYTVTWNKRDIHGSKAPKGTYNVIITLLTKPDNYSISTTYYLD